MDFLDSVSIAILLGAVLVLAGILSSLVALRFGAPLLLVFLLVGMVAGEGGPGGIKFDDVGLTYTVGSVALALILFDGGLRTRFHTFRSVLAPSATLATIGVLLTAALIAPIAKLVLDLSWLEALLVGAVVASTDAAAVFLLIHSRGLRLRPRVAGTLEVESGTNDPFAVFMTIVLVQILMLGDQHWLTVLASFAREAILGTVIGVLGGRVVVWALNRLSLAQGLHAPFVCTSALVLFGLAASLHASGFLAVYLAGLVIGNRPTRAHNTVVVFLDAVTWLAQIVMFVLLGLLVWPERLLSTLGPALAGGLGPDVHRPAGGGVPLSLAVPLPVARQDLHFLGRFARGGGDLPRFHPFAGRTAEGADLFRYRLRRGACLASGPGLDHRRLRAAAWPRFAAA